MCTKGLDLLEQVKVATGSEGAKVLIFGKPNPKRCISALCVYGHLEDIHNSLIRFSSQSLPPPGFTISSHSSPRYTLRLGCNHDFK